MPAVTETIDTVQSVTEGAYKWGFVTDIEMEFAPKGLNEDIVRFISAKKNEPEWLLEWRLKAYRHWLTMAEPTWAERRRTRRSTTRTIYYYAAPKRKDGRRAWTRSIPSCSRPTRSSASRCTSRTRLGRRARWTRCSTASRWRRRSRSKLAEAGVIFCSFSEAVHKHPELVQQVPRLGGAVHGQLLRGAELGGLLRRLVRLHPEGRALPDGAVHLLPHQRAEHRPVRAHADHRRRGRLRQLPRGLHGADARREPAARRGGRAGRARRTPRSSTRRCRTGTPATRTARAASTTSSPSAASAAARTRRSRWTQVETGSAITWKYPSVHPAGRRLGRRVLLGRADQQPPAGRHRHEDDPHRQEHARARSSPRASPPGTARTPTAGW